MSKTPINKIDFSCFCPRCGKRHTADDINGGRCVGCGAMLHDPHHSTFLAVVPNRNYAVTAENHHQVRKVLEEMGYDVLDVIWITKGNLQSLVSGHRKYRVVPLGDTISHKVEAIGQSIVPGSSGNETSIWLFFDNGTRHFFSTPTYEKEEA